jgi:hypothetical protein
VLGTEKGNYMQYLFLTFAALAIAAFASLRFTVSLFVSIAIIAAVVKITATKMMGPVSIIDAARSVAWAFTLLGLAIVALLGASQGQVQLEGFAAIIALVGLFACFVLGFKFALGASFSASAGIAVVSTLAAACLLFALKPLLF